MSSNIDAVKLQEIVTKGNTAWLEFMDTAKNEGKIPDGIPPAHFMADNFIQYKGKYMTLPDPDFDSSITSSRGDRYFVSANSDYRGFVLEFSQDLLDKMRKYAMLLGSLGDAEWEVVGEISDVFGWWQSRIFLEIRGIRVKDKFVAFFNKTDDSSVVDFVGEDLLIEELNKLEMSSVEDMPTGLTAIPEHIEPLLVAKLFYQLCIEEENQELWTQLFTKMNQSRGGMLRSLYNSLKKNERKFFHVRTDIDDDQKKKYFFQMKLDGEYTGTPKPITIVKDTHGEWRIDSASA